MTVPPPRRSGNTASLSSVFSLILCAGLLLFSGLSPEAARAQVTLSLTQSTLSGSAGGSVTYSATVQNFSSSAIYLQGVSFSIDPASSSYITASDDPFLANFPTAPLNPGDSFTGQLFTVNIASNTPTGGYSGTVSLSGNTDNSSNYTVLGSPQSFLVNVTGSTMPEPGSLAFAIPALIGMVSFGGVRSRRRRPAQLV